ncbi:MAG: SpoIIE family protein phosphatase [Firmicutes bacterium]|nr:SpoIIE family protein phosphatase [Alicyclobacillaceae bacterium]MCL6497184.1 SpoIIE family protein phosphatase [Bacillota bacterium]
MQGGESAQAARARWWPWDRETQVGAGPNPAPGRSWPRHGLWAIMGAVLGQALIYHHAAPFAWVYAVWTWRVARAEFVPAAIGAVAGTAVGAGLWPAGILIGLILLIPLPYRRPAWTWLRWPFTGLGAALLFAQGQAFTWGEAAWAALMGLGAVVLYAAAVREWQRFQQGDGDRSSLALFLTAAGAVVAGLAGVRAGAFWPGLCAGGLLILLGGLVNGPGGGTVAGATLGLTLALRGVDPAGVGAMVAAGFGAGWLERYHWRWGPVGLVGAVLAYAVLVRMPPRPDALWVSLGAAGLLWQGIPEGVARQLAGWGHALWEGQAPGDLPQRLERLAGVMREMARAFAPTAAAPQPENLVAERAVAAVCRRCSLYRTCWEGDFYRSYRSLQDLVARALAGPVHAGDLRGELGARCIRPEAVAAEVARQVVAEQSRADLRRRVEVTRELTQRQLEGVGQLLEEMARDWHPPTVRYRSRPPAVDWAVGIAKRPRQGGFVSGDTELVKELPGGLVVVALSDGMGVGPRAAWESGTAMALADRLLEAGFSPELAVRAVNATLLLRNPEEETFATLDLLVVDRVGRAGTVVKLAAPPSYLVRRGRVHKIGGAAPPVGILPTVPVEPQRCAFEPGDVLVMVTDGVLERDQAAGEERLAQFLAELPVTDSQMMAETILSFMLGHDRDGRDDATVAVVRILPRGVRETLGRVWAGVTVGEWRRVTAPPSRRRQPATPRG